MQSSIYIIEDDDDIRKYITEVLREYSYLVYSSCSGTKGLAEIEQIQPDLVILDLKLPDITGESICEQIKSMFPEMHVIILSGKDSPQEIAHGLNIGSDDYIPKPFSAEVLIARVRARLRSSGNHKSVLSISGLTLNIDSHEVNRSGKNISLSPQEFKLLHYLMSNPNKVLSRDMILSKIWGSSPDIETRVVDVYIGYLRKKIDKSEKTPLLHSIRGFGYVLKEASA